MRCAVFIGGLLVLLASTAAAGRQDASAPAEAAPRPRQQRAARNPIDRWNQMSPAERERQLAKLPPDRAQQIRERIRRYNQMPPQEKQALRERYQTFAQLPPDKQDIVRQSVRQFHGLPAGRRAAVTRAVGELRPLSAAQRRARLNSEEFRSRFSPQERQIVENITENLEIPPK